MCHLPVPEPACSHPARSWVACRQASRGTRGPWHRCFLFSFLLYFYFIFFWHPPLALSPSRSDSPSQHPRCLPGGGLVPPMGSIPTRGGGGRNPSLPPRGERSALTQIPFSILHRPSHLPWKHPQLLSIPVHLHSAHRVGARGICRAAS